MPKEYARIIAEAAAVSPALAEKAVQALHAKLAKSGKLALAPRIARELEKRALRAAKHAPRKETARENPALISGWRSLENGRLIDRSGKRALLEIYQRVTS